MKETGLYSTCDLYYNEYEEMVGRNIWIKSRKGNLPRLRALFYKVLREKLKMTYQEIADYATHKGFKADHCVTLHGVKKCDEYYMNYKLYADLYDAYFDDKIQENFKKNYSNNYNTNISDDLSSITNKITKESERQELYELVKLRVDSWKWKNKDECKVYQGSYTAI